MVELKKIAIMTGRRGRGSNMQAIIEACRSGELVGCAEVSVVVEPVPETPAGLKARELGISVADLDPKSDSYSRDLISVFEQSQADLICLAGFMSLLPLEILQRFPDRVINIHPALLPKFGGRGMYGMYVHEAVAAAREPVSGCTVHFVTEAYDEGEPILQLETPIPPGSTSKAIAEIVLKLEHLAYPRAIKKVLGCP